MLTASDTRQFKQHRILFADEMTKEIHLRTNTILYIRFKQWMYFLPDLVDENIKCFLALDTQRLV